MLLSPPDTKARVLFTIIVIIPSTLRARTMLLSRIIWKGHKCAKTESHTKKMEHLSYNSMVPTSQNLSSNVASPPCASTRRPSSQKDPHRRVERYQLESHLLIAQIEILQSHVTAYIADQPPGDLRYTPDPLAIIAARRHNERQEVKASRALAKEVRKLRMKREELLVSRERMKTEYEERQRSRMLRLFLQQTMIIGIDSQEYWGSHVRIALEFSHIFASSIY
ncbi:hypothetical protein ARMGADRAFT_229451 [Armillaria gallica]|uniref:Uncharacterized protein n=1 Tax=Armillaria gallica TaxID=47427 RepID=A0A2H3E2Y9_ARMGA|nr:hypothetical protein ARMGADRAFT_229451 [Armillaria gallica]